MGEMTPPSVATELACVGCGYRLEAGSACPECGRGVEQSIEARRRLDAASGPLGLAALALPTIGLGAALYLSAVLMVAVDQTSGVSIHEGFVFAALELGIVVQVCGQLGMAFAAWRIAVRVGPGSRLAVASLAWSLMYLAVSVALLCAAFGAVPNGRNAAAALMLWFWTCKAGAHLLPVAAMGRALGACTAACRSPCGWLFGTVVAKAILAISVGACVAVMLATSDNRLGILMATMVCMLACLELVESALALRLASVLRRIRRGSRPAGGSAPKTSEAVRSADGLG